MWGIEVVEGNAKGDERMSSRWRGPRGSFSFFCVSELGFLVNLFRFGAHLGPVLYGYVLEMPITDRSSVILIDLYLTNFSAFCINPPSHVTGAVILFCFSTEQGIFYNALTDFVKQLRSTASALGNGRRMLIKSDPTPRIRCQARMKE